MVLLTDTETGVFLAIISTLVAFSLAGLAAGCLARSQPDLYQPAFGGRSRRRDVAVKGAAEYGPGSRMTVWHNPGRPSESAIILRVDWSYYAILSLGMILTMGLAAVRFIPRGSKQALRKQS